MRSLSYLFLLFLAITTPIYFAGCSNGTADHAVDGDGHDDDHHAHDEEHEGPHGGHVIELGRSHAYHAELVDDEAKGTITVFILDKDLKELPIPERTIALNLTVDGQAQSFELATKAAAEEKASQFELASAELIEALHDHDTTGKLRVTIDGTPYVGDIEHHDHDDHSTHKH